MSVLMVRLVMQYVGLTGVSACVEMVQIYESVEVFDHWIGKQNGLLIMLQYPGYKTVPFNINTSYTFICSFHHIPLTSCPFAVKD
jgi:hypothetical protein